ncbi:MAG: dehydratase [Actinobacteria bacterium]|nr:dehydratase [Actinomycetota bacterium]
MSDAPSDVEVGTELPTVSQTHELINSVMYAGAAGDFNPLHFDPAVAAQISPTGGIIAHGMFSMGQASKMLTSWAGGPDRVLEIKVRFNKPWPTGTTATWGGTVTQVEVGVATVELWGRLDDDDIQILSGTGRVRID